MPELHHLENQGWEQMQQLLNLHLPQEPKLAPVRPIRPLFMLVAAACMSALFCMPSILTDSRYEPPYIMTLADNPFPQPIPNPGIDEFPVPRAVTDGNTRSVSALNNSNQTKITLPPYTTAADATTAGSGTQASDTHSSFAIRGYNSSFIADSSVMAAAEIVKTSQALPSETAGATADEKQLVRLPMIDFPMPAPSASEKITLLKKQAVLSVAAQLNRNLTASNFKTDNTLYNLPVYPSVTASVHINKAISFTTGISVLASGHFDKQSVSETTTPIGNSQVSTMAVVDKDQIKQAYYWQIPVTMDVAVRRNVSVSSGAGFAFLQKVAVQREARITDDNATQYVRPVATPPVVNTVLNRAEIQETPAGKLYNVKSAERRFLFNVQYQLKKFTLGLQYSRALSPSVVFPEHPELNIRNETLTLSVGLRLFH